MLELLEIPRGNAISLRFETKDSEQDTPALVTPSISTRVHLYDPQNVEVTPQGGAIPTALYTGGWRLRFQTTGAHAYGLYVSMIETNHEGSINESPRRPAFRLTVP